MEICVCSLKWFTITPSIYIYNINITCFTWEEGKQHCEQNGRNNSENRSCFGGSIGSKDESNSEFKIKQIYIENGKKSSIDKREKRSHTQHRCCRWHKSSNPTHHAHYKNVGKITTAKLIKLYNFPCGFHTCRSIFPRKTIEPMQRYQPSLLRVIIVPQICNTHFEQIESAPSWRSVES